MDIHSITQKIDRCQLIHCGISPHFHNKENRAPYTRWCKLHRTEDTCWAFSTSFIPTAISPEGLIEHILQGGAFTPGYFKEKRRLKRNFISSQLLALDFDGDVFPVSVEQAAADPFIRQYAFLIYPTPSSTPECPSTRVLFRLSEPVYGWQRWEAMQHGLIVRYAHWKADAKCKDAARLFYGSDREGSAVL